MSMDAVSQVSTDAVSSSNLMSHGRCVATAQHDVATAQHDAVYALIFAG